MGAAQTRGGNLLRNYEILMILPPDSDEQVVSRAVDRITQNVSAAGGKVERIDRWGRKRLAYEIAHQQEGYYLLVEATAEPAVIKEVDRVLSLADEVLRFKTTVKAA
jgi:small subunit ribosomal protein S6